MSLLIATLGIIAVTVFALAVIWVILPAHTHGEYCVCGTCSKWRQNGRYS
jgi:hypothetical protein